MPSKLAFLTFSYPRFEDDESSVFLKRLVEGYSSVGCSGVVIVPVDHAEPLTELQGAFEIHRYKYGLFRKGRLAFGSGIMPNVRSNPWLLFQVPLLVLMMVFQTFKLRSQYECIHANWVVSAFAAWLVHLFTRTPYVVTIRGEDIRLLRSFAFRCLVSPALRAATRVVSVSHAFQQELSHMIALPQNKMLCIPNGVSVPPVIDDELREFCSTQGLRREGKYLVYVGRVLRLKRVHLLIQLLADPELSGFELIICGRTASVKYMEELKEQISRLGVEPRVHFTGAVRPREVSFCLAISRYYLSASETEGRPNSVLEAQYAGVPVLLSNIPGHREVTANGTSGFLFEANDLSSAVRCIKDLERDEQAYLEQVKRGRAFVQELTWERTAQAYLRAFTL